MKLSARLILLLTFSVSVVMVVASLITLRQREAALLDAARDEARVHAVTLQIALEEDYLTGRSLDAQRLINRLRENTGVYSAALFDAAGEIVAISNTLAPEEFRYLNEAREAPLNGKGLEIMRSISGEDYFSMILPLQVQGRRVGAIEIVQSISFVKADIARARFHVLITTLLLFGAILLVVAAVTRYSLARPIHELLDAAVALGRGDPNYRAPAPSGGGELASLAREFNRMADRLAEQRQSTLREAEERLALERKLRHSEQLAAVGRLAAGVAHEMGAPLQVIDGRAKQLLHHPDAPTETRRRNLIIIRNQAERIARIVRQLLNLSRPHKLYFRRIELTPLVEEAAELIETQAESAGVEIEVRCDGAAIDADPELIQQVLLNIFRNGIQAMPQGGRLRVECLKDAAERGGRNFAALRVSDTGVGIAPESLPNIFDPFFTTKEVGQQTQPGDLFVLRNAGALIPPYGAASGGAGATIEYAVVGLGVKHALVMGHSNCGAMKGLLDPDSLADMPLVGEWLKHADATRHVVDECYPDLKGVDLLNAAIKENVLVQLDNLRTYPKVAALMAKGALTLHGWIYEIESGQILAYDPQLSHFVPITSVAALPTLTARPMATSRIAKPASSGHSSHGE